MLKETQPLADNYQCRKRQKEAIEALEQAIEKCDDAGLVFIRKNKQVFVFDQDKLYAAGWTPEQPVCNFLKRLGIQAINERGLLLQIEGLILTVASFLQNL